MSKQDHPHQGWKTSSWSADTACVEVLRGSEIVSVRHSKRPEEAVIEFTDEEWRAFVAGVKSNEFD